MIEALAEMLVERVEEGGGALEEEEGAVERGMLVEVEVEVEVPAVESMVDEVRG